MRNIEKLSDKQIQLILNQAVILAIRNSYRLMSSWISVRITRIYSRILSVYFIKKIYYYWIHYNKQWEMKFQIPWLFIKEMRLILFLVSHDVSCNFYYITPWLYEQSGQVVLIDPVNHVKDTLLTIFGSLLLQDLPPITYNEYNHKSCGHSLYIADWYLLVFLVSYKVRTLEKHRRINH